MKYSSLSHVKMKSSIIKAICRDKLVALKDCTVFTRNSTIAFDVANQLLSVCYLLDDEDLIDVSVRDLYHISTKEI